MSVQSLLRLVLLSLLITGNAHAANTDRETILALMEQAFAAVASRDPDDMRAIQLAEGTSISFRTKADGNPGELEMRIATNEAIAAGDSDDGRKLMERWTGEPSVMIRGPHRRGMGRVRIQDRWKVFALRHRLCPTCKSCRCLENCELDVDSGKGRLPDRPVAATRRIITESTD